MRLQALSRAVCHGRLSAVKIPKNLLLEAHNNPSTAEELAIALGIALPYAEEEIELLEKATLLKRIGSRYITNFFIEDKGYQRQVYDTLRHGAKNRTVLAVQMTNSLLPVLRSLGAVRNNAGDEALRWFLLVYVMNQALINSPRFSQDHKQKRNDGGDWGFVGYEENDIDEATVMSHNGAGRYPNMLWQYEFYSYKINDYHGNGLTLEVASLLADIIKNRRTLSALSAPERTIWQQIDGRFAHTEQDVIIPDVLVFEDDTLKQLDAAVTAHPLCPQLSDAITTAFDEVLAILKATASSALAEQLSFCATMDMFAIRMMTVNDAVASGDLIVPEHPEQARLAMWMIVK